MAHEADLVLPSLVISPTDVSRLKRELESLSDYLHQASLRSGGPATKLPQTSRLLDELATNNRLNFLHETDRQRALDFMQTLQASAPVITMSFATDPSSAFLMKVIVWLRKNIHPELLLRTGLQPSIAAGCTLRTANHYYDFSLRGRFAEQRPLLLAKLHGQTTVTPVAKTIAPEAQT